VCGRDLADERARRLHQRHRIAAQRHEHRGGHDQRNQDLHRRDAEVAQPGVDAESRALQTLREEGVDVRHRAGKVAAADAGEQRHELEYHSGVVLSDSAMPVPNAGIISKAVVRKMVLRPPEMRMKNEAGIRRVAPESPEIAASVKSSACENGNPRFAIWTVMIPHISQMANPHNRLGTLIQRLRFATFLPVDSQNALSSVASRRCRLNWWAAVRPRRVVRLPWWTPLESGLRRSGGGLRRAVHDVARADFGAVHPDQPRPRRRRTSA